MASIIVATVLLTILFIGLGTLTVIGVRGWWKEKWAIVIEMRRDLYGIPNWFGDPKDGPHGMNTAKLHGRVARLEQWVKDHDGITADAAPDDAPSEGY